MQEENLIAPFQLVYFIKNNFQSQKSLKYIFITDHINTDNVVHSKTFFTTPSTSDLLIM